MRLSETAAEVGLAQLPMEAPALDGVGFSSAQSSTPNLIVLAALLGSSGSPTGGAAAASTSITVRTVPYFNAYTGLWLDDQSEYSSDFYSATGDATALGTPVSEILYPPLGSEMNPNYYSYENGDEYSIGTEDTDSGGFGIAITGLDTTDGTWQFSPDDGPPGNPDGTTDWQTINSVSDTNALLLDEADYIRFVPNAGYFGDITDAITFRLWDETTGTAMTYADVSNNGGTTAFSADTATAALRVDPLVSITGSGGEYTISTTSAVPWNLEVSGQVDSVGDGSLLFTATIPADQSSVTVDFSTLTSIAIAATGLVGVSLDGPPAGYDYYLDPAASSVAITGTPDGNTGIEEAAVDSECQDGDTLAVTLDNSGATTAMSWYTVDGTAIAGQDYQSASGSVPAGQTETVDITLDNLDAPGGSAFFIHTTFVDSLGQTQNVYNPVTIQTAGLQLEADSNNDGRIDAESDAVANTTALSNNTGGVFEFTDNGNSPSQSAGDPLNSGVGLIATGRLVPIELDFNTLTGSDIELVATGDTQDFAVWTSPARTTQINVTGAGTTWPSSSAPKEVWVESLGAGEEKLVALMPDEPLFQLEQAIRDSTATAQIESQTIWQTAVQYVDATYRASQPDVPTTLLEWNAQRTTTVLVAASPAYFLGSVYITQEDLNALRRFAAGDPTLPPKWAASAIHDLTNEGFSAWYAGVGERSWVGTVVDTNTQYPTWQIGNSILNPIVTDSQMVEEAMSNILDYYCLDVPPTFSANVSGLEPGHDANGEVFAGLAGTRTKLNELGYLTAIWALYNGTQDPGTGADGTVLGALKQWIQYDFVR